MTITPQYGNVELRFLCTALLLNEIYQPTKFLVDNSCSFIYVPDKVQSVKKQRAITPKLGKAELRFLCNALLLNQMNITTKFLVDISCSFRVMSRTRCGRTDVHTDGHTGGPTDKAATICFPYGEHTHIQPCSHVTESPEHSGKNAGKRPVHVQATHDRQPSDD